MLTTLVGTVAVALLFVADSGAKEIKLSDLLPAGTWVKTGVSKLSDGEREQLRNEIVALLGRYRASLTDGVAVIAPSVSTSMKARELRTQAKLKEVSLRHAEKILVVVRSSFFNPLKDTYDSAGELRQDADSQLNIAGPKFHVYMYSMDDNLRVTRTSHESFDAQ